MNSSVKIRKKADQKDAATKSASGKVTASEVRQKIAHLQRIVNGVNEELRRLGSCQIEPDN